MNKIKNKVFQSKHLIMTLSIKKLFFIFFSYSLIFSNFSPSFGVEGAFVLPKSVTTSSVGTGRPSYVLIVDKATNRLLVCQNINGKFEVLKVYHATLGRVKGDKQQESDLKTPEGIYTFTSVLYPPVLQKKLGKMGFVMNFPNPFDVLAGYTGSGIMLHATNEPDRLKRNYDSQGCIVVKNEEILEIKPFIRLGITPILTFSELTPDYLYPGHDVQLKNFFEGWIQDWEKKDIQNYLQRYHSDFSSHGRDKMGWKSYKESLNTRYSKIEVRPENVLFYKHEKYSMITFTQNYRSKLPSGVWGFSSQGTKILYIAEELGKPKIISEDFTKLLW